MSIWRPRLGKGKTCPGQEQLALFGLDAGEDLPPLVFDLVLFGKKGGLFVLKKLRALSLSPIKIFSLLVGLVFSVKTYMIRKLVWGGGKLFGPTTQVGVLGLAVLVFVLGGTGWVRSKGFMAPFGQGGDILASAAVSDPITYTNTPSGEPVVYTVKPGDTLSAIGKQFKVSIASIKYANNLTDADYLKSGQELTIPPVSGVLHTIRKGETVDSLASKYKVPPQSVVDFNYLFYPFKLSPGDVLVIPGGEIPTVEPLPGRLADQGDAYRGEIESLGTGQFAWPTNHRGISQYFSRWHPAIDIPKFSPIYAVDGGTVVEVRYGGWNYGYGKLVRVDHGNGYRSLYAHLSSIKVKPGQKISRGQVLGNMGASGRAYGTHLHLEIIFKGRHINPRSVL